MSNWSHTIKVNIAERFYPLRIDKEDDEERIRKAAKLINDKLFHYKKQFNDKDVQDFLAIAALQIAVKWIELETKVTSNDQTDKLEQLNEQLVMFLKQNTDS